jgi:hypothetical protein
MAVTIEMEIEIARRDKQMPRLGWARFLLSSSEFVKMEDSSYRLPSIFLKDTRSEAEQ